MFFISRKNILLYEMNLLKKFTGAKQNDEQNLNAKTNPRGI